MSKDFSVKGSIILTFELFQFAGIAYYLKYISCSAIIEFLKRIIKTLIVFKDLY